MTSDLKKRIERGRAVRREAFGEADEGEWQDLNDAFDPHFHEYMLGFRWGTISARPGIDMRTRMLCRMAVFLSMGNLEQVGDLVERHMRGALKCGATPQEVVEVILETGLASGIHKWLARSIALRVFEDMGYKQGVDWGIEVDDGLA